MDEEVEIEIFRADPRAARGITAADLAYIAQNFDGKNPVPIVIGHPKSDKPAHGEVSAFRADGASLFGTLKNIGKAVVDGVKKSELLNRSMAFWDPNHPANPWPGKLAPRHLGFLGAATPGIANMPRLDKSFLAFSAENELEISGAPADAVVFSAAPTKVLHVVDKEPTIMDPNAAPSAEDLQKEKDKLDADRTAFQAEQTTAREAANATIVDTLVAGGRVLPADAPALKLVFNALAPEPIEFAADRKTSPASELARLLGGGVKLVPVDEARRSSSGKTFTAEDQKNPAKIDGAARDLMKEEPGLTFEAAVARVTGQEED